MKMSLMFQKMKKISLNFAISCIAKEELRNATMILSLQK